jgi:hypothetical protein
MVPLPWVGTGLLLVIAERPLVARKASAQFITDRAQTGGIMRRAPIIAAIALITLAHPVQAQTTSPESMAAAKELVITMRAADQFNAVFPMLMQQLRPVMLQGRPEIEKDYDTLIPQVITAAKTRIEVLGADAHDYAGLSRGRAEVRPIAGSRLARPDD